jgi:hypothetical protein
LREATSAMVEAKGIFDVAKKAKEATDRAKAEAARQ